MAVPKRKHSKARSRARRANYKLEALNLSECPQCHALKPSHVACKACGYYNQREVISQDE